MIARRKLKEKIDRNESYSQELRVFLLTQEMIDAGHKDAEGKDGVGWYWNLDGYVPRGPFDSRKEAMKNFMRQTK